MWLLTNLALYDLNCAGTKGNTKSVSLTIVHANQKSNANQTTSGPELAHRLLRTLLKP